MNQPPRQIGPYRIIGELGRGGMATVYRAVDSRTGDTVALKVLPPHLAHDQRYLHRFEREGRSVARLQHANIVRVFEAGSADGYHYLSMQFVDGQTLADLMRDRRSLMPAQEVVEIIRQVADALDYAHKLGILHRDIKSSNIMIDRNGRALLTDFGVAKLVDEDFTAYTVVGTTVGTPAFMAPEQAGGKSLDQRADVYSLGVIAYTMFTGSMPFKADSQPALLHKIVYDPPIQPEEVNPKIAPGVLYALKKVLSKSPSARYASAGAFADALARGLSWNPSSGEMRIVQEKMLATTSSQSQVAAAPPPAQEPPRRIGWPGIVALLALLAVLAVLLINPPNWLSFPWDNPNAVTPGATPVMPPETVTMHQFAPPTARFAVNTPLQWTSGEASFGEDPIYTVDDPKRIARVFVLQQHAPNAAHSPIAAKDAILAFFSSSELPYGDLQMDAVGKEWQQGDHAFVQQTAQATWLGRAVKLYVSATAGEDHVYLLGLAAEGQQADLFLPIHEAMFKSLQIDRPLVGDASAPAETPTPTDTQAITTPVLLEAEDSTSTPEPTTPAPSATPTDTPTATSTPTFSPTPDATATAGAAEATVQAAVNATLTAMPTPTWTSSPTPSATPPPTSTPIPPPTALPTATSTATVAARTATATPLSPQAPAATATRTPTARPTFTPTPPPTATATRTPNAAATQTAVARTMTAQALTLEAAVKQTLTAMPAPTETNTPTPTSTLVPTSTPLPTATKTFTPTRTPTPTPTPTRVILPTATFTAVPPAMTPDLVATLAEIDRILTQTVEAPTSTQDPLSALATIDAMIMTSEAQLTPQP